MTPNEPTPDQPMPDEAVPTTETTEVPATEPTAEAPAVDAEAVAESVPTHVTGESPEVPGGVIDALPADAPPRVIVPALPPQPVPQVPAAPNAQDLSRIAQDLQVRKAQVEAVVQLLDSENTVPFITRYRKERTGGLDETQIRRVQSRLTVLRDIASKKQSILRSIANQGKLTDELTANLLAAESLKRLDDLYLPYKAKKKSLAADAKEKGLEPLAIAIWTNDPIAANLAEVLPGIVDPWKQLHDVNDVLTNLKLIIAEMISDSAEVRGSLRAFLWDTAELASTRIETVPEGKGSEYRDYSKFREAVREMPPHRVLAVNRGERENILRVRIDSNRDQAKGIAVERLNLEAHPHRDLLISVVDDALDRLILPSLEREIRREMTEFSQDHAVDIFARNLHSLLMRPPLGGKRVLAIDPGIRTGCKVAALDETGTLLEDGVIFPHPPQKKVAAAKKKLEQLIRKHNLTVVAVGNGTACRETEQLVSDLIAELEERRVNPTPAASPIPQGTVETTTSETPLPAEEASAENAVPNTADVATTATTGDLGGAAETTMIVPGIDLGESTSTAVDAGLAAAEAAIHVAPAVLPVAPPAPAVVPEEVIDLDGLPPASPDLAYVIVNEAGASDYSASPQAKEEFPDLDATTRGTISIGRRLQDPLSELVKVDPQHVGVGLYQHDVRQKYLKQSVESVIESCVNTVGVDLNTASIPLLRHVSGFNQLVARNVVDYRTQHGRFTSREQLMSVPQMGEARFTQAAGFLKIAEGGDPLDTTSVHPESYELARKVLEEFGYAPADLLDSEKVKELREKLRTIAPEDMATKLNAGPMTVRDIYHAVARPGRDPRSDRPEPIFRKGVLKLEDLVAGMELRGEVLNVVDFGAFVDVGLKDSGLVHISQIANRYIKSPHDAVAVGDVVKVWVMTVDGDRKRVSLTMLAPGQDRKPQERGGERAPRQQGERGPRPPQGERQQGDRPPQGDRGPRPPRPQGDRPPQPQGDRPQGDRPQGDRPQGDRRDQPRPSMQPGGGPGGPGGPRPFPARPPMGGPGGGAGGPGGPRPARRPTGPGAPGWRSSGKPTAPKPAAEVPAPGAAAAPGAGVKKTPDRPKQSTKLSDQQKSGRSALNSFGQLAMFFKKEEAAAAEEKKSDEPKPDETKD